MEYFDVVDENDKIISKASRNDCHRSPNLIHRGVHVFVINSKKQIFVQKRGENVDIAPGLFGSSAAGHVTTGDTYNKTAFKELKEELNVEPEMLIPLFKLKIGTDMQTEIIKLYFCYHNDPIKPNLEELGGGEFMDIEKLIEDIGTNEEYTYHFKKIFEKFYREFWVPNRNTDDEEKSI